MISCVRSSIPVVLVLLFIARGSYSQIKDAGLRQNIYLEKRIAPELDIYFNQQSRIHQNVSRLYLVRGEWGIDYKRNKYIHFMLGYMLTERRLLRDDWSTRHRGYLGLKLRKKIGAFYFSDRVLFQVQYKDIFSAETGKLPNSRIRNKVAVQYNNSRYTYCVAWEMSYKLNPYYGKNTREGRQFDRVRYFAGVQYEVNKANEFNLYYLYEKHFNINIEARMSPAVNSVIGVGYAHYFY